MSLYLDALQGKDAAGDAKGGHEGCQEDRYPVHVCDAEEGE